MYILLFEKYKNKYRLDLLLIKNIIDQASNLGCINFDITGGEPLLHKNLKDILQYIYDKGMKTTLFTNGYLINDQWCSFFKSINLDNIKISIDSINDCLHSKLRQKNTLDIILKNINMLIKNNIKVMITTIVSKPNLSHIDDIVYYFENLNPNIIHYIDSYIPNLKEIDSDPKVINPSEYCNILYKRCIEKGLKKVSSRNHYCGFAFNYLFIDSSGNVKLCPTFPKNFDISNIKSTSLKDCWDKIINNFYDVTCKFKNECKYFKFCAGGCRHRALVFSNHIDGKDIYMCRFYQMMEENKFV